MILTTLALAGLLAASDTGKTTEAEVMAKMAPAFKGTIVNTYPDGRKGHLKLHADHTYSYTGRRNDPSSGTWSLNDDHDKVCMKQRKPHSIPFTYCTVIPNGKSWSAKAPTGEPIRVTLVSGG